MAKMGFFGHSNTGFFGCTQLEKAGYKIKQTEWNAHFDWYLEASKRGNEKVTSCRKATKNGLKLYQNF